MGWRRAWRKRRGSGDDTENSDRPKSQDDDITAAKQKDDVIERQKNDQEAAARAQQADRDREVAILNAEVDRLISDDSEAFLRGIVQPGGE